MNVASAVKRRRYRQEQRATAAAATRRRLLDAARAALTQRPLRRVSINEVAAAADVARSTVYDTFGSRGGLFDAIATDIFMNAGMQEIADAFELPDPIAVMETAFPIGSRMYAREGKVWRALESMGVIDRAMSGTLIRSEERRWASMRDLAARLETEGYLGEGVSRETAEAQLWIVTSFAAFDLLADRGLTQDEITAWMFTTTRRTLKLGRLGGYD